jgi:hypothetical protein
MIKKYTALIVIASALPLPAFAQSPVQAATSVAAIPLDRLCRADGALDLRFGDRVEGAKKGSQSEPVLRELDGAMLPFEYAELGYSRYSFRFWNSGYVGTFVSADEAIAAAELMAAKAKALNWQLMSKPEEAEGVYEYRFSSKPEPTDPPANDETTLYIAVEESTVSINCENTAQSLAQSDEAMGKMPVDMPMPQLADYAASISNFTVSDCDDPAKLAAFEARLNIDDPGLMSPGWSRFTYEEDLANWKMSKLVDTGKTDFDTLKSKTMELIDNSDYEESLKRNLSIIEDFAAQLGKLDPDDKVGLCRVVLKMVDRSAASAARVAETTGDAVTPQWHATHQFLDKEAQRLGVSFGG